MRKDIDENMEKKTVEKKVYIWTCPNCGKKIRGPTRKKVRTNAKQHRAVKHNGGEDSE